MTVVELNYEDDCGCELPPWVLELPEDLAVRLEWWLEAQGGVQC